MQASPELVATVLAQYYRAEKRTVVHPQVTKTVEEQVTVKVPTTRQIEHKAKLAGWVIPSAIGILVAGLAAGFSTGNHIFSLVGSVSGMAVFFVGKSRSGTTFETIAEEAEQKEIISKVVVVEPERTEEVEEFPGVQVVGLGIVNVPVEIVVLGTKKYFASAAGGVPKFEFAYPVAKDSEKAWDALDACRAAAESVPYVLKADETLDDGMLRGEEREWKGTFQGVARAFRDYRERRFQLPLSNPLPDAILKPGAPDSGGLCKDLAALMAGREGVELDNEAEAVVLYWVRKCHPLIKGLRDHTFLEALPSVRFPDEISKILWDQGVFNYYCLSCNQEKQEALLARTYLVQSDEDYVPISYSENTRCTYQPESGRWVCPACGSDYAATECIPVHRIADEILLPTYDRLMDENKNERLAAYAAAMDKELDYANQREQELDSLGYANRAAVEDLQKDSFRIEAEVAGELQAIASLEAVAVSYSVQYGAAMQKIAHERNAAAQTFEASRNLVEKNLGEFIDSTMAKMREEMGSLARSKREEDRIRDSVQVAIAAKVAEQVAVSHNQLAEAQKQTGIQESHLDVSRSHFEESKKQTGLQESHVKVTITGNAISAAMLTQKGGNKKDVEKARSDYRLK